MPLHKQLFPINNPTEFGQRVHAYRTDRTWSRTDLMLYTNNTLRQLWPHDATIPSIWFIRVENGQIRHTDIHRVEALHQVFAMPLAALLGNPTEALLFTIAQFSAKQPVTNQLSANKIATLRPVLQKYCETLGQTPEYRSTAESR